MRRTEKYRKALSVVRKIGLKGLRREPENQELYDALEDQGYWWDHREKQWDNGTPPSTSIFANDDGSPTDIGKIRVMAHPDKVNSLVSKLKKTPGVTVIEISEKAYPNRKGIGSRVYVTVVMG